MQALVSNSQRLQILQQLFADIALKVDDRARGAICRIVLAANFLGFLLSIYIRCFMLAICSKVNKSFATAEVVWACNYDMVVKKEIIEQML